MWEEVVVFGCIGFAAQAIDGALGMAYGVTATTMLLGLGVAPPIASASVHTAEVFTTAVSGTAHWQLGNVDVALLRRLAFAGIVGGATGAYLSTALPGSVIRPFVSLYLLAMGIVIIWRAIGRFGNHRSTTALGSRTGHVAPLGVVSGFLDAIGGGGWGAMVTSTLIGWRMTPRLAIGSANAAEFFVTSVVTATGSEASKIFAKRWFPSCKHLCRKRRRTGSTTVSGRPAGHRFLTVGAPRDGVCWRDRQLR
jgi:uncharacterized membrane protein YfcA